MHLARLIAPGPDGAKRMSVKLGDSDPFSSDHLDDRQHQGSLQLAASKVRERFGGCAHVTVAITIVWLNVSEDDKQTICTMHLCDAGRLHAYRPAVANADTPCCLSSGVLFARTWLHPVTGHGIAHRGIQADVLALECALSQGTK